MSKKLKLIIALELSVFLVLAVLTACGRTGSFNAMAYDFIAGMSSPVSTAAMLAVSTAGEWYVYLIVAIFLFIIPATRPKVGLPLTVALGLALAATYLLKHFFHIDRPDVLVIAAETGYSFPSGHALYGTAFIGLCCYLFMNHTHISVMRVLIFSVSTIFLILMGISRIYLGAHSAIDVMAGYTAGLAVVQVTIFTINRLNSFTKKTIGI